MSRQTRKAQIEALQNARGSHVITYVTATRENLEAQMAMDVIEPMYEHLRAIAKTANEPVIDLFLYTNGGDGIVPWRLVTLIREFTESFNVLVPNRAFSAGTLTALGADTVIMHPMGMLGPTDATVANPFNPPNPAAPGQMLGISVEDVASYIALVKEDVGITHEDELVQALIALTSQVHPLALGNVKRSTLQSRMMGEKLLRRRGKNALSEHDITEIVRKLTSELYYHGHPINRREAREELGLSFVEDATEDVADAMWGLYLDYAAAMKLNQPFDPIQEALAKSPLPPPAPGVAGVVMGPTGPITVPVTAQQTVALDPIRTVYVESTHQCDVYETSLEVVMTREANGTLSATATTTARGWTQEP
jgi:hypothetical protein